MLGDRAKASLIKKIIAQASGNKSGDNLLDNKFLESYGNKR